MCQPVFIIPYLYGPFDAAAYRELDDLSRERAVEIDRATGPRIFSLTPEGYRRGTSLLEGLPERDRRYLAKTAAWVLSMRLETLLSAVCRAHPDMAVGSIATEVVGERRPTSGRPRLPAFVAGLARTLDVGAVFDEATLSPGGARTDAEALRSDWQAIGDDLRRAMSQGWRGEAAPRVI